MDADFGERWVIIARRFTYIHRMARKTITTRLENDLQKEVKKLAIDLERPFNDLLEEALKDLLKKYDIDLPKDQS